MPAPLIPLLRQQIVNGSGAPYAGAKINSYVAGTTTRQDTYSDSGLTTANANPVVADADGRFGAICLDPALTYKFVVTTTADVEIFTQDNVTVTGAQKLDVLSKVASYTVLVGDGEDVIVLCDCTAGAITVTLYTAVGNAGRKIRVVKTDSSANAVTVDPNGSQTWGGAATRTLGAQYEAANGVSDGSNWAEFANFRPIEEASQILATQVFA